MLAAVTNGPTMAATIGGLRPRGELLTLGRGGAADGGAVDLISASRSVVGHPSGTSKDSQDTVRFAALTGIRPVIETMPLEQGAPAYERMLRGPRFRVVLTMG